MKTIFVCSAGFGEGHNAAARGILDAFDRLQPPGLHWEFLDLNARVSPKLDEQMRKVYLRLLSRAPQVWAAIYRMIDRSSWLETPAMFANLRDALAKIFAESPPAAVVSTYPFYGFLLDELARHGGPTDFARITVVTDSISINSIWFSYQNPCYLVTQQRNVKR